MNTSNEAANVMSITFPELDMFIHLYKQNMTIFDSLCVFCEMVHVDRFIVIDLLSLTHQYYCRE